jgi:hypothetical protein
LLLPLALNLPERENFPRKPYRMKKSLTTAFLGLLLFVSTLAIAGTV